MVGPIDFLPEGSTAVWQPGPHEPAQDLPGIEWVYLNAFDAQHRWEGICLKQDHRQVEWLRTTALYDDLAASACT